MLCPSSLTQRRHMVGLRSAVCTRHPMTEDNVKPISAPNGSIVSSLHKEL